MDNSIVLFIFRASFTVNCSPFLHLFFACSIVQSGKIFLYNKQKWSYLCWCNTPPPKKIKWCQKWISDGKQCFKTDVLLKKSSKILPGPWLETKSFPDFPLWQDTQCRHINVKTIHCNFLNSSKSSQNFSWTNRTHVL